MFYLLSLTLTVNTVLKLLSRLQLVLIVSVSKMPKLQISHIFVMTCVKLINYQYTAYRASLLLRRHSFWYINYHYFGIKVGTVLFLLLHLLVETEPEKCYYSRMFCISYSYYLKKTILIYSSDCSILSKKVLYFFRIDESVILEM